MNTGLLVLEVIISILLIITILLQSGDKSGLGLLGGASEQLAGNQTKGADSIYRKITAVLGVAFLVVSLVLVKVI